MLKWLFKTSDERKPTETRRLRLERLEERALLSVTPVEYAEIRELYSAFELPENIAEVNIIDLNVAATSAQVQTALAAAKTSPQNDLIVLRTTEEAASAHFDQAVTIDFDESLSGKLTIVSYGDALLSTSSDEGAIFSVVSGSVNLGGFILLGDLTNGFARENLTPIADCGELNLTRSVYLTANENDTPASTRSRFALTSSAVEPTFSAEYPVEGSTWAYVADLSVTEAANLTTAVSSYQTSSYYDVNKNWNGDDQMCWAASASNLLKYAGFDAGMTVQEIFDEFKSSFTDDGGAVSYAVEWFLNGVNRGEGLNDFAQLEKSGGGYYVNALVDDYLTSYSLLDGSVDALDALTAAATGLRDGCAVSVGCQWENGVGHATTVWGYYYDSSVSPSSPAYYTDVIISCSDDGQTRRYRSPIEYDATKGTYKYVDYRGDGSGEVGGWRHIEVLKRNDGVFTVDGGDTLATAKTLTLTNDEASVSEALGNGANGAADVDVYKIYLKAGTTYGIGLTAQDGKQTFNAALRLTNASGQDLASVWGYAQTNYTPATSDYYYLAVSSQWNCDVDLTTTEGRDFASTGHYTLNIYSNVVLSPDLTTNVGDGWNAPLVFASSDSRADEGQFFMEDDVVYAAFNVWNRSEIDFENDFKTSLTIWNADGEEVKSIVKERSGLLAWYYWPFKENLGKFAAGVYTVKLTIDSENALVETNESNNVYTTTLTILPSGAVKEAPSTTVTTTVDVVNPYDGKISLREALRYAAVDSTLGTTITFAESTQGKTIELDGSAVKIEKPVAIQATNVTIDAKGKSRVFEIAAEAVLSGLTITGGLGDYGGGVYVESGVAATFANCLMIGNKADYGGALYAYDASVTYRNVTIADNKGTGPGGYVIGDAASATLYNSIVAETFFVCPRTKALGYAYNVLSTYHGYWDGGSNQFFYDKEKPLFVDAANGDYRLAENSQALNKGNNSYISELLTDLAGNPRVAENVVDLGSYEGVATARPTILDVPSFIVTASSSSSLRVGIEAVANASGYALEYSTSSSFTSSTTVSKSFSSSGTYTFSGLRANTTYYVRVKALGEGDYADSAWSSYGYATTPGISLSSVTLSGTPKVGETLTASVSPSDATATYQWYYGTSASSATTAISGATSKTFTITDAYVGKYLKVVATGGGSYSGSVSATTSSAVVGEASVLAPTNVKFGAYDATNKRATLTWTDNATNEVRYEVQSSTNGGASWNSLSNLAANTTSRVCSGLQVGATYMYRVRAVAADGTASEWVVATITPTEATVVFAPTDVEFGPYDASTKKATLTWTDNATNEVRYEIQSSTNGGAWKPLSDLATNATSRVCGGLEIGNVYQYRIRAVASDGTASDWVVATITPTEATVVLAPTNVKFGAYDATNKRATLTWTDNATNEVRYEIQSSVNGAAWKSLSNLAANTTSRVCGGLEIGNVYQYRLRAVAADGTASEWVSATITPTV
ncbi:MAG: fibronectin type III domain-containing protein, partial [Thermoguttaceae bacterium]|nr:fibronectin type III domain-containing protein [Thermoguttaceae bacterium]